ncbi:MAG TPA: peptide deformylase [Armatimonadota bacterium]|nr:peptide deformylase [Armatimonadota bacterium]
MAEKEIVTYPDPILRQQAKAVSKLDAGTKKLAEDMVATLRRQNGLGLAANQVGALQKVFVYDDGTGLGILINPKIASASGEQVGVEGCLSVPGLQGEVKRANFVEIRGTDLNGKPVKIKAEGLLARIFQHELDHLNGTLFIDRADPNSLHYVTEEEQEGDEI